MILDLSNKDYYIIRKDNGDEFCKVSRSNNKLEYVKAYFGIKETMDDETPKRLLKELANWQKANNVYYLSIGMFNEGGVIKGSLTYQEEQNGEYTHINLEEV